MKYLIVLLVFLVGCSTLVYETEKGEKFTYRRVGAQSLEGLQLTKDDKGNLTVDLNKNTIDSGSLGSALADMAVVAKKSLTK